MLRCRRGTTDQSPSSADAIAFHARMSPRALSTIVGQVGQPVEQPLHAGPHVLVHAPRPRRGAARQVEQLVAGVVVHPQRAGQRGEHLRGRLRTAPLLEADHVVDAHARQLGDLLATQARRRVGGCPRAARRPAASARSGLGRARAPARVGPSVQDAPSPAAQPGTAGPRVRPSWRAGAPRPHGGGMTTRPPTSDHRRARHGRHPGHRPRDRPPARRARLDRLARRPGRRARGRGRRGHRGRRARRRARRPRRRLRRRRRGHGRARRPAGSTCSSTTPASRAASSPPRETVAARLPARLRRERARPGAHHARVPAAARPLVATPDRHGVQRHGLVRDHDRPGPVRVHAARARLPVVQGGAEHDHVPVRQGAAPATRSARSTRATRRPGSTASAAPSPWRRAPSRPSARRRSSPARRPARSPTRRASCPGDGLPREPLDDPAVQAGSGGGERDDACAAAAIRAAATRPLVSIR